MDDENNVIHVIPHNQNRNLNQNFQHVIPNNQNLNRNLNQNAQVNIRQMSNQSDNQYSVYFQNKNRADTELPSYDDLFNNKLKHSNVKDTNEV